MSVSAAQVKEVLLSSSMRLSDEVMVPGSDGDKASFSTLSVTGGVVNAFNAIQAASNVKGKRKKKYLRATSYVPQA